MNFDLLVKKKNRKIEKKKIGSENNRRLADQKQKPKRKSKFTKPCNSPLHNCQKHLIVALKSLIFFPNDNVMEKSEEKMLAKKIWEVYEKGDVKVKKMLHFIFNEKNEYSVSVEELKKYGLDKLYQESD